MLISQQYRGWGEAIESIAPDRELYIRLKLRFVLKPIGSF